MRPPKRRDGLKRTAPHNPEGRHRTTKPAELVASADAASATDDERSDAAHRESRPQSAASARRALPHHPQRPTPDTDGAEGAAPHGAGSGRCWVKAAERREPTRFNADRSALRSRKATHNGRERGMKVVVFHRPVCSFRRATHHTCHIAATNGETKLNQVALYLRA